MKPANLRFRAWYLRHKDEFNEKRREEYAANPRARYFIRSRRLAYLARTREVYPTIPNKGYVEMEVDFLQPDGTTVTKDGYTLGAILSQTGMDAKTYKILEERGEVPKPSAIWNGTRLYTEEDVALIVTQLQMRKRAKEEKRSKKKEQAALPKEPTPREAAKRRGKLPIPFIGPDGQTVAKDVFSLGEVLAAIGRTRSMFRRMEDAGMIPKSPFEDGRGRIYNVDQLRAIVSAFKQLDKGKIAPEEVRSWIDELWKSADVYSWRVDPRILKR